MPVTVELSEEVLARLRSEAGRRGVSIDQVISELTSQLPADATTGTSSTLSGRTLAFLGAGASEAGITTAMDAALADGFGRN